MKTITIEGQLRTEHGKQATRQLRSQGQVPGVIYGGAKEISFSAPSVAFKTLVYTPEFQLAEIKLNGDTFRCIMKDLQFDKVSDKLIHIDLLELAEDKKVVASIPLKFVGIAQGVKDGGVLYKRMKALKVKTLPKYLKEFIEINVEDIELNASIRVEDVQIEHYEILNSPRIPIVQVGLTRALKEEVAPEKAAVAGVAAPVAGAPGTAAAAPAGAAAAPAAKEKGKS